MWLLFVAELSVLPQLILFDGRISWPGGGWNSAAASWPLFLFLRRKGFARPRNAVMRPRKARKLWPRLVRGARKVPILRLRG